MTYQLVCIAGTNKGRAWDLHDTGLVLGRDAGVDVVIDDPIVSRRHCLVIPDGNEVRLQNLGSRNPTLVDGQPATTAVLKSGHEFALGRERFLLTVRASERARLSLAPGTDPDTQSWAEAEPVAVPIEMAATPVPSRPQTLKDLVLLYEVTRELSSAATVGDLMAVLDRRLRKRFDPLGLWLALVRDDGELTFQRPEGTEREPSSPPPVEIIRKALDQKQGLLAPGAGRSKGQGAHICTMVSPIALGGVNIAVLAVESGPPRRAYHEEDLRFLVLLAQAVAPLVSSVMHAEQLRRDNERLRTRAGDSGVLVGDSRAMARVRAQIARVARSNLSVLITGDTGTGKELAARCLHAQSSYRDGPLVVVNCAAIPRDLFESMFFGHQKGAFTGAHEASAGLMAQAHGGTLFLDEVADLSLDSQARILRAIELLAFRPVGAERETHVDLRVVAATNKDIPAAIREGTFREDLYHRLNGFEIRIPPLNKRPSDIPVLARYFFDLARQDAKRPLKGIGEEALEHLLSRRWPGNVRELRNCIVRAIAVARNERIGIDDVLHGSGEPDVRSASWPVTSLAEIEKRHIATVLEHCGGNIKQAAGILQVSRTTLYKKIQQYGLQ